MLTLAVLPPVSRSDPRGLLSPQEPAASTVVEVTVCPAGSEPLHSADPVGAREMATAIVRLGAGHHGRLMFLSVTLSFVENHSSVCNGKVLETALLPVSRKQLNQRTRHAMEHSAV